MILMNNEVKVILDDEDSVKIKKAQDIRWQRHINKKDEES